MNAELEELYQALILDHDARPRNYRQVDTTGSVETSDCAGSPGRKDTLKASCYNPICGDSYIVYIEIKKDRIETISFGGRGCAISKASLSMMTTILMGKTVDEALQLYHVFRHSILGNTEVDDEILGELAALITVRNAPTRIKCALLGWEAMNEAVSSDGTRT